MKIFTVKEGLLVLNLEELRGIRPFRDVLARDKGSEGDHDGRKKYRAFKEFYYIYYVADFSSFGNLSKYNEKELHIHAVKESGLEDTYKPDALIKECIDWYKCAQLELAPSIPFLQAAIGTLKSSHRVVEKLGEGIEHILETLKTPEGETPNIAEILAVSKTAADQLELLLDISARIPKAIENLEALEERVKKEQSKDEIVRGGKKKGNRADPT